jgi:hypothetical protein
VTADLSTLLAMRETTTTTPLGGHLVHLAATLGFVVVSIGGVALSELLQRAHPAPSLAVRRPGMLPLVAGASIGAAGVHGLVMPEHFNEATLYGAFFAIAATLQLGYAALLLRRPSGVLLATGLAGNLAMLCLWLLTRTVAIPFGPAAGSTEPFGVLDVLASSSESLVVIAGSLALRPRRRTGTVAGHDRVTSTRPNADPFCPFSGRSRAPNPLPDSS